MTGSAPTLPTDLTINITRRTYQTRTEWVDTYQAFCLRCANTCRGANGSHSWATKPPALRAARMHLDAHVRMYDDHVRAIQSREISIVGTVTL